MKMAKKFLAVALAGVLALSVLTGCGNSVKSKDIADSLNKMGVKVELSKEVDETAEKTLKAIETIIAADSANKITLTMLLRRSPARSSVRSTSTATPMPLMQSRRLWVCSPPARVPRRQMLASRSVLLWSRPRMPRRTQTCRLAL